jgi:transposase
MMTVHGVGHIAALPFVLTLGDKSRFRCSRDVGCYLGLRPKRSQSGERDPQLGITKAGNALRQWGLHLAARGGKQAKNKSVVAVARKLAVLLHHLWTTQQPYVPFHQQAA